MRGPGTNLMDLPERTVFATVECAGNGRSFLAERQAGVQWGAGAVGHAEWTGVPLKLVLERSGLEPDALEVLFEGADVGTEPDHPAADAVRAQPAAGEGAAPRHAAGVSHERRGPRARSRLPAAAVRAGVVRRRIGEVAAAHRGGEQTVSRLLPVRQVHGPAQDRARRRNGDRRADDAEVGDHPPAPGDVLGLGGNRLFGVAWAGEDSVSRVEVSTDGGATWSDATLMGPQAPYSWTLWEYLWEAESPGEYTILVRATSSRGRVQPADHDPLNGGYLIHHSRPLCVRVAAGPPRGRATPTRRRSCTT